MPASSATLICVWLINSTSVLLTVQNASVLWVISKVSENLAPIVLLFLRCSQVNLIYTDFLSAMETPSSSSSIKKKIAIQNSSLRWPKTLALQGNSIFKVQIEIAPERIDLIGLFLICFLNLKLICSRVPQSTNGWSLKCIWTMEVSHSLKCTSTWLVFVVSRRAGTRFFLVTTGSPGTSPVHRLSSGCKIKSQLLPLVYKALQDLSLPTFLVSPCLSLSTMTSSSLQRFQTLSSFQAFPPAVPFVWIFLKTIKNMYWWVFLRLEVSALVSLPQRGPLWTLTFIQRAYIYIK